MGKEVASFSKLKKKCSDFGKKFPDHIYLCVKIFFKIDKKRSDFGKKFPDLIYLWVKILF